MDIQCIKCDLCDSNSMKGERDSYIGTKILYAIVIKLILIQTRLLKIKKLVLILRATAKEITKNVYILKETIREIE